MNLLGADDGHRERAAMRVPLLLRVNTMRRYVPLLIAGAALIAAACRDLIAPGGSAARQSAAVSLVTRASNVTTASANSGAEARGNTSRITLSPRGGFARIGAFVLVYPSDAVCDPNRSGYGPSEWQKPCPILGRSVTIRARSWTEDGVAFTEFTPNIRFDPSKRVTLNTFIPDIRHQAVTDPLRAAYAIGYTMSDGTTRFFVDETASDPSTATVFGAGADGTATGFAQRRIYHFSGYYVRSGRACDDSSIGGECGEVAPY
jgi:hypothetical protein